MHYFLITLYYSFSPENKKITSKTVITFLGPLQLTSFFFNEYLLSNKSIHFSLRFLERRCIKIYEYSFFFNRLEVYRYIFFNVIPNKILCFCVSITSELKINDTDVSIVYWYLKAMRIISVYTFFKCFSFSGFQSVFTKIQQKTKTIMSLILYGIVSGNTCRNLQYIPWHFLWN